MREELITFETAKLAKEKGFYLPPVEFGEYYDEDGNYLGESDEKYYEQVLFTAPTQSLLQRWLREKHKLYVMVEDIIKQNKDFWRFEISNPRYIMEVSEELYDTYEKAMEEGLKKALKLIKS